MREKGDVRITDASAEGFAEFLEIIYKPKVNFVVQNLREVMRLISKYDVPNFYKIVELFLIRQISPDCVCQFYELVSSYKLSDELNKQFRDIICESSEIILMSLNFLELSQEMVADILKWDDLNCREEIVFEATMAWAKNAPNRLGGNF